MFFELTNYMADLAKKVFPDSPTQQNALIVFGEAVAEEAMECILRPLRKGPLR